VRDISIGLTGSGAGAYRVGVRALLIHIRYDPYLSAWKLPLSLPDLVLHYPLASRN
jgi:hypothetical protein